MQPLDAFFGTMLSRSTPGWSFSTQMTRAHPILISSHLHHSHPVSSLFRSKLAGLLPFFIHSITVPRDTPNIRFNPRRLLRSSYALKISSLLSSRYACGVGFSRL